MPAHHSPPASHALDVTPATDRAPQRRLYQAEQDLIAANGTPHMAQAIRAHARATAHLARAAEADRLAEHGDRAPGLGGYDSFDDYLDRKRAPSGDEAAGPDDWLAVAVQIAQAMLAAAIVTTLLWWATMWGGR